MGARALIVVDRQNGFLREGNLASERCLQALPAVIQEVEAALAAGHHVIFTADSVAAEATETFDAPRHPGDVAQEHALSPIDSILGATVEGHDPAYRA